MLQIPRGLSITALRNNLGSSDYAGSWNQSTDSQKQSLIDKLAARFLSDPAMQLMTPDGPQFSLHTALTTINEPFAKGMAGAVAGKISFAMECKANSDLPRCLEALFKAITMGMNAISDILATFSGMEISPKLQSGLEMIQAMVLEALNKLKEVLGVRSGGEGNAPEKLETQSGFPSPLNKFLRQVVARLEPQKLL